MNRKIMIGSLMLVLTLCLAGSAWAYQIEFSYGPYGNYAFAYSEHKYDLDQSTDDWTSNYSQRTATAEAWSPWESPSAIAQAVASPIGTGPVATVNLQVNDRTAYLSYAYGRAVTSGSFTILQDAGDTASQIPIKFTFHVTGIQNLQGRAYSDYSYSFWLDDVEMHNSEAGPPTLDDLFSTTLVLEVGLPYAFQVGLNGELDHESHNLDTALYQASLDIQVVETPLPPSLLFLGSGLLGLSLLSRRRKQG